MFDWLQEAQSPYFWLLPFLTAVIGGISSLLFAPLIAKLNQRLELSSRAWARIQDRRLDAYEALLEVGNSLKEVRTTGKYERGHLQTVWLHMDSPQAFQEWRNWFMTRRVIWENWIDNPTSQHTKYLEDYMENLRSAIFQTPPEKSDELAILVKSDLIALGTETVDTAHRFFSKIDKKTLRGKGNGKYRLKKTEQLLSQTRLFPWLIENGQLAYDDRPRPEVP